MCILILGFIEVLLGVTALATCGIYLVIIGNDMLNYVAGGGLCLMAILCLIGFIVFVSAKVRDNEVEDE